MSLTDDRSCAYRGLAPLLATVVLLLPLAGAARAQSNGAVRFATGFSANTLAANDDGSTGAVPIGFTARFFGTDYTAVYVNNNGNITFDAPLSDFTPFDLSQTQRVIVAPFFADVDTRGDTSSVYYGTDVVNGRPAFAATWPGVGYYAFHSDKLNTFQVVLIDRSDVAPGAFDIELNYDSVEWETGDVDGGVNGLGGTSARAGFSDGTGITGTSFELPGSGIPGAFLDTSSETGLVYGSRGSTQLGRYVFPVPCHAAADCDDASLCTTDACDPAAANADGRGCTHVSTCPAVACRSCNPATGACGTLRDPEGTPCDDGNACTVGDLCIAGSCGYESVLPDGDPCDTGDACTEHDTCTAGECVNAVACNATSAAADPSGKPVIDVTCGGDGPTAARGEFCEAEGFDADSGTVVALVVIEPAGGGAVKVTKTKNARKKLGKRTGRAQLRLHLNRTGKRLLRERGAETPPRPLNVDVAVRVRTRSGTTVLRQLVALLKKR